MSHSNEAVILLHGLARTPWSMHRLARAFRRLGYHIENPWYPSQRRQVAALSTATLAPAVERCRAAGATRIHIVAYSMGGILLRHYLEQLEPGNRPSELGRLLMLGTPNHGSEVIDLIRSWPILPWWLGPAAMELGTDPGSAPNQLGPFPREGHDGLAIIAGSMAYEPLMSWMVPKPSDGRVSVASAQLEGAEMLVVPHSHPMLLIRRAVIEQAVHWIENGRFGT